MNHDRTTIHLDGEWWLGEVPQQPLTFHSDDRAAVTGWLPAAVPGNIHADLVRAGRLPALYHGKQIEQVAWVDDSDWWLQRDFTLSLAAHQRAFLHFDGIDYLATIWLDGEPLARHEGAFSRHTIEITEALRRGNGSHRLAVRFWGARMWPLPRWRWWERLLAPLARRLLPGRAGLRPYHPRLRLLRPPMQAGWDFAPTLAAIGLWEGVRVEVTGPVRLDEIRLGGWQVSPDAGEARGHLSLSLDSLVEAEGSLRISWTPANFDGRAGQQTLPIRLRPGKSRMDLPLTLPDARRWHPWEQGAPHLYQLRLELIPGAPFPPSIARHRFGIRSVELEGMRLRVNGQPLFARGVNWVPCDILPGTVPRARYEQLLRMARERGVNLLRVWGGGGRERRDFYELCDEMGLLLWQEFPFACTFLDHYPRDPAFLGAAHQEATAMVRELRHHPSLLLWCAGNEFSHLRNRPLVDTLERIVRQESEHPFLPPSPGGEERHSWHVWHGSAPVESYAQERTPFLSEFGLQAPPGRDSLERFLPGDALWPPGPLWEFHHADLEKLTHYTPPSARTDMERFISASQDAQARGVQIAVERMRRRKATGAGGVAIWQWNEPWPAISWALVDYYGQPKKAAEGLRDWYHPLLLSLDLDWRQPAPLSPFRATLWAINDLSTGYLDCEARLLQAGRCLWSGPLALPPFSARPVADLELPLVDPSPLRLELWQGEKRLASNQYELCSPLSRSPPPFRTLYRSLAELIMRW